MKKSEFSNIVVKLGELPSPFYRVGVKAIILDEQGQLLVGRGEGDWEIPGGGLEHHEDLESGIKREIAEELGAEVESVGEVMFVYRGRSKHGWMIFRAAVPVKLKNYEWKLGEMSEAKFVPRKELSKLKFEADEGTVLDYANKIWPKV